MALPASLSGRPPAGPMGPASVASGNPGLAAKALAGVRQAIQILTAALPDLPPGTPVHKDVLNAISGISKHVPAGDEVHGVQMAQLQGLARSTQAGAALQGVMRASGAGGQPGGMPGGAPGGVPGMPGMPSLGGGA